MAATDPQRPDLAAEPAYHSSQATVQPSPSTHPSGRPPEARDLPEQFGRYRILKRLGQGGMGSVYLAHDSQLDRSVAVKVPHFTPADGPEILERFHCEARAAATIEHPNICPVYDVGQIGDVHYLTMSYIEGQPLSALVQGGQPLPQRPVAALVCKLALALQEAHRRGVVHRDLKPANIMINQRREPVIMDFGLARRVDKGDVRLTRAGALLGTPAYMPPEQVTGDVAAMGPACDNYSLGVILYELLTGRLPFEGTMTEVLSKILSQEPVPPTAYRPDLDPRLEAICRKALAKKPQDRFASMDEMAAALTACLQGEGEPPVLTASGGPVPEATATGTKAQDPSLAAQLVAELLARIEAGAIPPGVLGGSAGGPHRRSVWPWIAATIGLVAVVACLAYVVIQRRTAETTVVVHLDLKVTNLTTVVLYLDGKQVTREELAGPISLKTGPHELKVQHDDGTVETSTFTVGKEDNQGTVEVPPPMQVAESTKPPPVEPAVAPEPPPEAKKPETPPAGPAPAPEAKKPEPAPDAKKPDTPPADLPPVVKALVQRLNDSSPAVRKNSAVALRNLGDKSAVPALMKRVGDDVWFSSFSSENDPEGGGKNAALTALKELAPDKITAALLPGLRSKLPQMRVWAAEELRKHKDKAAVPDLVKRVADEVWYANISHGNDPEAGGKAAALTALKELAPDRVVEALVPGLRSKTPAMRVWAAVELGKHKDKAAVPDLAKRVADEVWYSSISYGDDPEVGGKAAALTALRELAPDKVTEALLAGLKSKDPHVRAWSVEQLAPPKDKKPAAGLTAVVRAVAQRLGDEHGTVRKNAAETLRKLGDRSAVPDLMKRVGDEVWFSSITAGSDPEAGGKAAALAALKELASDKVVEGLGPALRSKAPAMRVWAAVELGKHKDKAAVPVLMKRVADEVWLTSITAGDDPENGGKAAALTALKELAPDKAPEALVEALDSKNEHVKAWAASELGKLKEKK